MASTISDGVTTLTAALIRTYQSTRRSGNIVRRVIGTDEPAVSFRPSARRSGTLHIVVGSDQADCAAFEALLASDAVLTFADTEVPGLGMSFVTTGTTESTLDPRTRKTWVIDTDFEEV